MPIGSVGFRALQGGALAGVGPSHPDRRQENNGYIQGRGPGGVGVEGPKGAGRWEEAFPCRRIGYWVGGL